MNKQSLRASTPTSPSPPMALEAEGVLRQVFQSWAYIETRFNVLQPMSEDRSVDRAQTYSVADETGGLLTLRPDFTSLVAQEAATAGRDMARPLRRSYCGSAFRKPDRAGDGRREIWQSGVEMIGASGSLADVEVVSLASEGLAALKLTGAQIHLGHVGFVDALLRSSSLSEQGKTAVCNLLSRQDRNALTTVLTNENVPSQASNALLHLLDLVGSPAVLSQARNLTTLPEAIRALDEMEQISSLLDRSELPVPVVIDLTEVRDRSYYTGIRFEGFVPASGFPILRGGRYDNLSQQFGKTEPAIGCAFEMDRIAPLVARCKTGNSETILLRYRADQGSRALKQARLLRAQGRRVVLDVLAIPTGQLEAYCAAYGIDRVLEVDSETATDINGGQR